MSDAEALSTTGSAPSSADPCPTAIDATPGTTGAATGTIVNDLALIDDLLAFIAEEDPADATFEALALRLFAHQFRHNTAYARLARARGRTPATVKRWQDIPPVSVDAFKALTLSCVPTERCERVFTTSGTTRAEVKGRHFHPDLRVWNASMRRHFTRCAHRLPVRMAILFPDETAMPNSSLAHYLQLALQDHGKPGSRHVATPDALDIEALYAMAASARAEGEPLALLGASWSFVALIDHLITTGQRLDLPEGSWVLDTGGYKGRSREVPVEDFYATLSPLLGVPRSHCINMYGMTELSSQCYDAGNETVPSVKRGPHWMRTRAIDPLTGADVAPGTAGVLVHTDLASHNAVTTILTEDVGILVDGGFQLLGRAQGAQAKGCSLAVDGFTAPATGTSGPSSASLP